MPSRLRGMAALPMRSPYSVDETLTQRWRRRAVTIPFSIVGAVLLLALSPLVLTVTLLVDLVRRKRFATTRFAFFAGVYLWTTTFALIGLFLSWVVSGTWAGAKWDRICRHAYAFQRLWARALYRGGEACFGVHTEVDDTDFPKDARGPFLVFIRHTSLAETMLPLVIIRHERDIPLRYVIKRELLNEPGIDVAGQRIPNAFVRRSGNDLSKEVEQVRRLARDMTVGQGVLIYPEGTRFSPKKHAERLSDIRQKDPGRYERVKDLRCVLPIRLGGPLALLDERPDADVLFIAHTGFEAVASSERMMNGALVGKTVKVKIWRVPSADIPKETDDRVKWLDTEWNKMDKWVEASLAEDDRADATVPAREALTVTAE
ncbi:MAG: 1-acyl-sn-glycerol-3-phosphate acyltransferase [Polyangiaceae bacterium]|nr:1-acyl-sn-glycerol-3-phosphate acyltransferase [Polyangiaceae bacterium]